MNTKLKINKRITEESRMKIRLVDTSIIVCKVEDWQDNSLDGFHIINTEDSQILVYTTAIVRIDFEKKEKEYE